MLLKSFLALFLVYKTLVSFVIILVISFLLMSEKVSLNFLFRLSDIYYPALNTVRFLDNIDEIYQENKHLRLVNYQLRLENHSLTQAVMKSLRAEQHLSFMDDITHKIIPASVIVIHPDLSGTSIIIDKGLRDGVRENLAIADQDGIIGKIVKVSERTSLAKLISDTDFRVSVFNPTTEGFGILKTNDSKTFFIDNINDEERFSVGDTLYSTGLGGIFPRGIPAAKIVSFEPSRFKPFPLIKVEILSELKSLDAVFIIDNLIKESIYAF